MFDLERVKSQRNLVKRETILRIVKNLVSTLEIFEIKIFIHISNGEKSVLRVNFHLVHSEPFQHKPFLIHFQHADLPTSNDVSQL